MSLFTGTKRRDADAAIATFNEAARHNREEACRHGSILRLPPYGQVVMTGDLHGHMRNLEKLQKYAMLERFNARHVVLHEMVHADLITREDVDNSHELLLEAAAYKCEFPDQVHFLQSNHELAQLTGYLIAKNGRIVIQEYNDAVERAYGKARADDVLEAMNTFIATFPLAIRTQNRVWLSHSLPNIHNMDEFDPGVFERDVSREELDFNKTVFHLVWGRRHSQEHIEAMAKLFDVDIFICGHQPQETGFTLAYERLIILASNHNHGTFLPFDLSKPHTPSDLMGQIRKFVEVA